MREKVQTLSLDKYEHGILIYALNDMRTKLIEDEKDIDFINDLLLKVIDAPTKRIKIGKGGIAV